MLIVDDVLANVDDDVNNAFNIDNPAVANFDDTSAVFCFAAIEVDNAANAYGIIKVDNAVATDVHNVDVDDAYFYFPLD